MVLRGADVFGLALVVVGGGTVPPDPLGHPTDTKQAWRRIPVVFSDEVLTGLPDQCVPIAGERVVEATLLPEFEHPELAMYLFGPENGSLDETILRRCLNRGFGRALCLPVHRTREAQRPAGLHPCGD